MADLSFFSTLIPVWVYLLRFKSNKETWTGIIFLYLIFSFFSDFLFLTLPSNSGLRSIGFVIFSLLEFLFFSFYLSRIIVSPSGRKVLFSLSFIYIFFVLVYIVVKKGSTGFDTLPASVESLVILVFCITFFFEQIKNPKTMFLYNEKSFWIVTGLLIYVAGTFFLFIQSSFFSKSELRQYWILSQVGNILKNLLFAVAFFIKPNSHTKDESYPFSKSYQL